MRLRRVCVVVLGVASAAAQESSGSITGTVVDATGTGIPASVTIVGHMSQKTVGKTWGEFLLDGLEPGVYTLEVRAPGFATRNIATTVVAGRERSLGRIVLEVGPLPSCEQVLSSHLILDKKIRSGAKPSLSGVLRSNAGVGLKNATISLLIADTSQAIAITKTNEKGEFQFLDVSSGVYGLSFDGFLVLHLSMRRNHAMNVLVTLPPHEICL